MYNKSIVKFHSQSRFKSYLELEISDLVFLGTKMKDFDITNTYV